MSMRHAALRLDLLDNLVFSERAASTGAHRSLDYVPGAALLGALAQRLYATLQRRDLAMAAFHAGMLRFGNAIPLQKPDPAQCRGTPAWPMPLSLHRIKGEEDSPTSWAIRRKTVCFRTVEMASPNGNGNGSAQVT